MLGLIDGDDLMLIISIMVIVVCLFDNWCIENDVDRQ